MVEHILSQDEVDALLSAVDRGELPDASAVAAGPAAADRRIIRYNFRKPNRVAKDQVRMLHSIHDTFARLYTASLTALLRGVVEVELKSVEQVTYGEFVMSLAPPTCVSIFNMDPLKGGAAMEINAGVLFRFIDRLLGGSGLLPVRLRDFTEVEQLLVERVAVRAMMDLQQSWQHAGTFGFRVAHVEPNPQFVQLTAPSEVVVLVSFEVRIGGETGPMVLAYPHLLLEPIMPKLNSHHQFAAAPRAVSAEEGQSLQNNVLRLGVTLRGVLAETPVTVRDLLDLRPGSVIKLPGRKRQPAVIEIEGVPRFRASAGTSNQRKALQLTSVIQKGEIIRDARNHHGHANVS